MTNILTEKRPINFHFLTNTYSQLFLSRLGCVCTTIDLLAIQQKSLDRALFLYIFIHEIRSSGVRASITIVHIRKFYKMYQSIVRLRFFFRIAKRSIPGNAKSAIRRNASVKTKEVSTGLTG